MKPARVRSAQATMASMVLRPSSLFVLRHLGTTISTSRRRAAGSSALDDVPAVHLALVDLLGAVIKAGRVAQPDRVGGGEETEELVRSESPCSGRAGSSCLRPPARAGSRTSRPGGPASYSSKHQRAGLLQCPGQNTFAEFRHLLAVFEDDCILADQIDTADMTVQIDAHARPVQAGGDLLDVGRFTCAVIPLDQDAAVVRKPSEDRHRRVMIKQVGIVDIRDIVRPFGESRDLDVRIQSESLPYGNSVSGASSGCAFTRSSVSVLINPFRFAMMSA